MTQTSIKSSMMRRGTYRNKLNPNWNISTTPTHHQDPNNHSSNTSTSHSRPIFPSSTLFIATTKNVLLLPFLFLRHSPIRTRSL
mmetsp:Transcript_17365/g.35429  ORF Transcript_17365/g.35429 Transcript_17365/m.35429 type:complete len:84 (-) Transcript_17365:1393-1644(-)